MSNLDSQEGAGWGKIKLLEFKQQPAPSAVRSPSGDSLSILFDDLIPTALASDSRGIPDGLSV